MRFFSYGYCCDAIILHCGWNLLTLQLSTGCRQSPHPSDSQYRHFLHPVDNHAREFNNSQFQIFIGKVIAGYQQRLLLLIVFYLIFNLFNFIIKI